MVFESLVVDLLNKYLGPYVKNLDPSQLKIGIWGGNVVLDNLELKDTALDDLDLPIKVVRGYLGKLVLSIPWKNLYTEATVVEIQDLHLVAKPNFDIKYNEEREEKAKKEKKQKQIENIEEARRREEEKKLKKENKPEESDGFAQKLATNVIKNLQVTIKNIHIRYEDSVSDIKGPFALGITMESLSAQTTGSEFIPKVIKESVTIIHKLVKLDNLAVYWNPGEKSDGNITTQEWLKNSQNSISSHNNMIPTMNYILSPMVASQKLKINTKPGVKLDIPQMFMNLVLEELGLNVTRSQYHGVVQLLESFERMNRNQPFKKYRPSSAEVPLLGNAQHWWNYCITSVLEEDVRRRMKMWSWKNIKNYRALCKKYKEKYKEKVKNKNPAKQLLESLESMEEVLNIASVTIFRRLAESEVLQEKNQKKEKGSFFSFFSRSKDTEKSTASKIEGLMGSDSKEKEREIQKLYDAIGYSENEVITPFAKEYVAVVVESVLQRLSLKIIDDTNEGKPLVVIHFCLDNIILEILQRPSAQALKAAVKIGQMKLFGTPTADDTPLIIKNVLSGRGHEFLPLVDFVFETNPLEKPDIDQCITAVCQPLEIIYDANTITKLIAFSEPPQHVILQDLQEKAYSTFEDFKVSSTAGLLHAMETRTIMDIDVNVSSSHLIIPEKGVFCGCTDMVVIDFGSFSLKSDPSQVRNLNPKDIDNIDEVQSKAYDRFLLKLNNLQVLLCKDGEDFRRIKESAESTLHILHPIEFDGKLAKAILPQDPRLKQICVSGDLTRLYFSVSDDKVSRLIKLVDSLPLPGVKNGSPDGEQPPMGFLQKALSLASLVGGDDIGGGLDIAVPSFVDQDSGGDVEFFTPSDDSILTLKEDKETEFSSGIANQVKVEMHFTLSELKLSIAQTDKELQTEKDCLQFIVEDIGTEVTLRRWDMFVNASIGRFVLNEMTWGEDGEPFEVVSTPKNTKMLKLTYRHCGFNESLALGPSYFFSHEAQVRALQFKDEYQSTVQMIDLQIATLYLILHQEALLSIMSLIYQVLEPLNKKDQEATSKLKGSISAAGSRISLSIEENEKKKMEKRNVNTKSVQAADELKCKVGLIDEKKMRVTASMDGVGITICSAKVDLAQAYVKGLSANVLMKDEKLEVKACMKDMQVQDNAGATNYKKIISMQAEEVFDLEIVVFENGTKGSKQFNMSCVDTSVKLNIGQMRVVFLYRFIVDLINFVDNFEDAKNSVIEASKSAKEKAVIAASELSKHSSRIQLNVLLRAPTIVVPVGSTSDLALLVDLGELRVFNNFKVVNNESKHNKNAAITDNMTIRLADLKLLKSLIKDGDNIMHQRAIVEPMVLKLGIVRNLTPANHIVADVEVEGVMPAITLSISEEDIAVALKILQGNIAEGEAHAPPKKKKGKNKEQKDSLDVPQDRLASIYEEPEDDTMDGKDAYTKIRLKFDLEHIDVRLYLKPPDMTFEDEFLERNDEWLLSLFTIGNLKVSGEIMSDESMKISVLLSTLILDDMRPSEDESLKRMINYSPDPLIEEIQKQQLLSDSQCMLDLKFQQSSTLDKKIEVNLSNLLCIFNMEFIMKLVRTLLAAVPKEDRDIRKGSISSVDSPSHESSDDEADISYIENYVEPVEGQKRPEMRVQVHVRNPQIVLLADAKDVKTNALFLTTEINFQYVEVDDVQKILAAVAHTAILSTAFKKEHRSDISTVLSIDFVNLHSSAPINGKPHMHLNTTLVKLNISPKTIQTISACSGHLTSEESEKERIENQRLMSQLWGIKEFTKKKSWYLDTPPQHVLSAGSFVLARTENGVYKHGFLSKRDTHFTVFFYPEGQISHKVADVTSVINDIVPIASEVYVGVNVIACKSKESEFRTGRVMQIWKGERNSKELAVPTERDWDILAKNEDAFEKYLVRFYHDGSESYYVLEGMRLVSRPRKGVVPGVGANVYARYNDGFYYHGLVESISDYKIRIDVQEIGEEIDHDLDDPSAVILNMTPLLRQVKKHFKVIASKSETTKGYHPGKVLDVQGSPGCQSYIIKFEDGTRNQVPVTKLLLMPKAPYDALPEVGTYVYSRVARDAPLYEKGIVAEKRDRICVKHLNGRKLAHEIQNIGFVVRNIVPLASSLRLGQDVIAQADSDDQNMYLAKIIEVIAGDKNSRYMVQFTDGSKKKLTPGRIRILSQYGSEDTMDDINNMNVARKEHLVVEVEGVSLRVEGYLGGLLTPMLKLDSKLTANIKDWSTKMTVGASLSVQASYYNDSVAEWEPLIEPVIENNKERPWQLAIDYAVEDDNMESGDSKSNDNLQLQKPESTVKIESHDSLEMTLSNACIGLLGELGKVFGEAVEAIDVLPQVLIEREPFLIKNKLGKSVTIKLNDLLKGAKEEETIELGVSETVGVFHAAGDSHARKNKLPTISLEVEGFYEIKDVAVKRQRTIIYDLIPKKLLALGSAMYSLVIQIKASDGQRIITIRSPLQLKNHFPMPLDISYITKENKPAKLTTVESGATFSIPLLPAYHSLFHVTPAGFGYNNTTEEMDWSNLKVVNQKEFVCFPATEGGDAFFVQVVMEEDVYTSIHGMIDIVPKYTIHCYPPIVLHNYLPYPIKYKIKGMGSFDELAGGTSWPLFTINVEEKPVIELELENYLGTKWMGSVTVSSRRVDSSKPVSFVLSSGEQKVEVGVYYLVDGALQVTLYAPYWLLNKTGKSLIYQAVGSNNQLEHLETCKDALMLFVKGKQKKAKVCLKECGWSSEFSLDTIGSGGSLKSEGMRGRLYEVGVGISLSYFGLTKIVTFTPLRMLTNHTQFKISMAEFDSETAEWHTVNPNESIPYWPAKIPLKNLYLNIKGIDSLKFNPEPGKTLLLKFRNEIGGVCVNYQVKDSSSVLSFTSYFDGAAPVRIENLCKKISMISYKQVDYYQGHVLTYGQSVLYTWSDPTSPHELVCSVIEAEESETKIKLDMNDFGRMKIKDGAIYWVSFLDGLQRVLLFTDNFKSAYCACQEQMMRPKMQVNFNIESFGLSLANVDKRMEIGYLAIRQSESVWEQYKKNRWKALPIALSDALEEGYITYEQRKGSSKEKILDMEVDFEKMFITKPQKIKIRRTFHSGIGFQYTISPNRMQVSATISSMQLDSHIPGSTFLTVIHVVKPPKSIASENAPKPFFELSLTTRVGEKNVVNEVIYFKVLIQELDVRIDKGFLLGLMEMFTNEKIRGTEKERYTNDMSQVTLKFEDSPELQAAKQDRHYVFSYFHLSPLKIHVSFSMTGGHSVEGDKQSGSSLQGNVLSLLLQSVGVAFTEIQDVEFKLACFEVESTLLSNAQLTETIGKHYQNQAIKQLYVLVLGLDVLGNPYGLITGVGTGAKNFFYEPYQGLIQGPEEFAEGLAYGVKSLVGGTVGGVSGAVSKITGTVGKGLAALTMDDEYQQKRRQDMSQRPTNLGQGLVKGGKGLVKGIFSGVTGVVTKPYEGAKTGGAGGFMKGIGKGLIGVVARPAGGVVDMASSTFEGLKSTTSGVKSVAQSRISRVFHADKVLRPFNVYEADGNKILVECDKGAHKKTNFYMAHVYPVDKKNYLILTNKGIMLVSKSEILNDWESLWYIKFTDLKGEPEIKDSKITFQTHNTDGRKKSIFKKLASVRVVTLESKALAKWFMSKIKDAKLL